MIKIRPVRQSDIKKIVEMIEFVSPGVSSGIIEDKKLIHFPFNFFHKILPVNFKFLQECYIAVEDKKPLGLISLAPDGKTKTRWKINRLVLGADAYNAGKQLIEYVVNKYGGAGVENFLTIINENCPEAITLFKNTCMFRYCSKISIWENENFYYEDTKTDLEFLRKAKISDAQKLFELDSESLYPHFRPSLIKTVKDFQFDLKNKLINKFKGCNADKYILDNPSLNSIEGLLSIYSSDKQNFWIDITLSSAYQQYYQDFLNFAYREIKSQNRGAKIYIGIKDYQQTANLMTETLTNQNFKQCGSFQILIKDYWQPIQDYKEKKSPIVIFPDMTSPACNMIQFINET